MIIPLTYVIKIKIIFKQHKRLRRNEGATRIPNYTNCQAQGMTPLHHVVSQLLNQLSSKRSTR